MPLTDLVPSAAFDVLLRNTKDIDQFVNNDSGNITTRTGDVITPIPVLMQQAQNSVDAMSADVATVSSAKDSSLLAMTVDVDAVSAARASSESAMTVDVSAVSDERASSEAAMNADVSAVSVAKASAQSDMLTNKNAVSSSAATALAAIASDSSAVQDAADSAITVDIPAQIERLGLIYPPITYAAGLTLDSHTKTYVNGGALYIYGGALGVVTSGSFDESGWQPIQGDVQLRNDISSGTSLFKLVKHVPSVAALKLTSAAYDGQVLVLDGYSVGSGGDWIMRWDSSSTASETGAVIVQVSGVATGRWIMQVREFIEPEMFGAVADGISDNTQAVKSALEFMASSGIKTLSFGYGTYLFSNSSAGEASWDNHVAVWVLTDGIRLVGKGEKNTKLALANGSDCHVIKFGKRVDGSVSVSGCEVVGIEIDGNRSNQITPDDTVNHHSLVDVSTGCSVKLKGLHLHDAAYYGIGFQRDSFENCTVEDVLIERTGSDGIDFKGDSNTNLNNKLKNITVKEWGLITGLTSSSAAIDIRSGVSASGIVAKNAGVDGLYGIRLQNGTSGATPLQASSLKDFRVFGSSAANSVGVRVISRACSVSDGKASGFTDGISVSESDNRLDNINTESNGVGLRLWSASGTSGSTCNVTGLIARNNGQAGVVCDTVSEVNFIGSDVRNNGIGYDIRAGSSNVRVIGGSCAGNTTALSDLGSDTVVCNVTGLKTQFTGSASIAIDSTGTKSFTIAHNLSVTPSINDVNLTLLRDTNVGDFSVGFMWVTSADSANIYGQVRILTASATPSASVKVKASIRAKFS